jgi:uncharacterized protein YraI
MFSLIILLGLFGSTAAGQSGPPVLAFYYAWFDQATWSAGQAVDSPLEPYISADRAVIERQVGQAQAAGIDAFIQSWYGPQEANNQTETNFRTLLEVAGATGFKAGVNLEVAGPFFADAGSVTSALASLLASHVQHPAYFRYHGRPVIFFWRQQRFSVEEWQTIRDQLDPDRATLWIAEGTDIAYQAIFDGHHLYSIAWAAAPADQLAKWAGRVRDYEAENQVERLWIATTMPGYDDTRLPRSDTFAVARRNGDYYRESWQGAVASEPDMIMITSFNEWPEGTHLEPSVSYGNLYLDLTRELVTNLRGAAPAVAVAPAPATAKKAQVAVVATETSSAQSTAGQAAQPPAGPYIQTTNITNVRLGPGTDFERVGRLGAGETAVVIGQIKGGEWWLIEFEPAEAGQGWVAAEVVDFVGDSSQVPVVAGPSLAGEAEAARPTVEVPTGGINVRAGPGLDFALLGRLEDGETATVVGQSEAGDWWQIEYAAAAEGVGWITAALVDFKADPATLPVVVVQREGDVFPTQLPTPTVPAVAGTVEALDAVNVRLEPKLDAPRLGGLFLGETADVVAVSEDGQWWQIDYQGDLGWVAAEFVRFQGNREAVPIFGVGTATPTPGPAATPTLTPAATATPTPNAVEFPTAFAPTATSIYDATTATEAANRGSPDPGETTAAAPNQDGFAWGNLPWGVLAIVLVAGILWLQFSRRRHLR